MAERRLAQSRRDGAVLETDEPTSLLLVRDIDLTSEAFDEHIVWKRHRAQMEGTLEAPPRRSIFGLPVLSPYHPIAGLWTTFMMAVDVVYTAFWVPLGVAFCTESFGDIGAACTQVDLAGGCVYFVNVIASFSIGIVLRYTYKRAVVTDGVRVAWYYMGKGQALGNFWIDILSVVPFIYLIVIVATPNFADTTGIDSWVNALSLLRLLRLLRLVSLSKVVVSNTLSGRYQEMLPKYISVTTLYTVLLVYTLAVAINLGACLMLLIAYMEGLDQSWMTSVSWTDFTTASEGLQWYAAVYWVITTATTTGYGDFYAHSTVEQVFANIYMIFGMLMFGLLVGTIANALTRASATAAQLYRFRNKMSSIGRWLTAHSVPDKIQKQVKDYFSDVWVIRDKTSIDTEIFNDMPTSLRAKVARYVTMDVVSEVHLFRAQEDGLRSLVAAVLRPVDVIQGHDVCRQGEEGDRMWLGAEGELQALQHQSEPIYLGTPCLLGESVLLGDEMPSFRLRPYTLRAATGLVKLWECKMSDMWPIVRMYPRLKDDLLNHIRTQLLQELGFAEDKQVLEKSWCESVSSISNALLKQSASVIATAAQELQAAQIDDGSLTTLIDGLMDFSTTRAKRITLLQPMLDQPVGSSSDEASKAAQAQAEPLLPTQSVPIGTGQAAAAAAAAVAAGQLVSRPSQRRVSPGNAGELRSLVATSQPVMPGSGQGYAGQQPCCTACGRAVCAACRQTVRPGPLPQQGSGYAATVSRPTQGHVSFSESVSGAGGSVLLASLGANSVRSGWQSMSRPSRRPREHRPGISTMSIAAARPNLAASSIPTENFGEGYGLWG